MNASAFHLGIEAVFSLLVLALLLSAPVPAADSSLSRLQLLQKQQDLLAVWVAFGNPDAETMRADFVFVFPGRAGIIGFAGDKFEINLPPEGCTRSTASARYLDGTLRLREITLTVFC
ncbi:MAG: hypothetical protein V1676_01735 [Candidatus Diapherotrites archaeon]